MTILKFKIKKYYKFVIIFLCTILFYFIYYKCIYVRLIALTDSYVSDKLDVITQAVENNIETKLSEVQTISEMNFKYAEKDIDFNKIMGVAKDTLVCENIFIGGTDGKCISNKNEVVYMKEYPFFKSACEGKTVMSEPIYSYNNKKWVTAVSSPIRDEKGNVAKVIVVFYDVNELEKIIENISLGDEAITFITTKDKVIVTSNSETISKNITKTGTIPDNNSELTYIKNLQNRAIQILNGEANFIYEDARTKNFFKTFKENDWVLVSSMPKDVMYSDIYTINFIITIITLFIMAIAIVMMLYSSKLKNYLVKEKKKSNFITSNSNIITLNLNLNSGIVGYNENFVKLMNLKPEFYKNHSIYSIIPESYYSAFDVYFERAFNQKTGSEQLDMPLINGDGKWIYVLWNASLYPENNQVEFIGTNISNLKDYERKIQKLAYFDQLTGLNNLVYLKEYFENIISTDTTKTKIALLYLDIDNFKYINDMFGHNIGDNLIIDLGNRIASIENIKVKICKRSGDEFAICYEYIEDENELQDYINSVFDVLKKEYYINNVKLNMSISMGAAIYPDDAQNYEELFKCADIALQAAKNDGKNRVKYFNNSMKNEIYEIISIENNLKSAIENNEFVLYYQPQYNITTGKLYGFEALIRWLSPTKGFVQPDKFIPQAEKNQLIIPIGKFAFIETCNFINRLKKRGVTDLCIAVNVSVVQMMCDDFVDFVLDTIKEKNIDTKNIKIEITESVLIKSVDEIIEKMNILNKHGVLFSIDDFGTGYSSLSYLSKIPFNVLKIDKSFTDIILDENKKEDILSLIINLAKVSNLSIVAEGIEDARQLKWLADKECDIAQGFFMGKPMPENKAFEIIGKNMYDFIDYVKS